MRRHALAVVVVAVAAAAGCNAYDPDLGDRPFRCGAVEPRCPDGYSCNVRASGDAFCERGQLTVDIDSGVALGCEGDDSEPNDRMDIATTTPIPLESSEFRMSGLKIC